MEVDNACKLYATMQGNFTVTYQKPEAYYICKKKYLKNGHDQSYKLQYILAGSIETKNIHRLIHANQLNNTSSVWNIVTKSS